MPREAKEVITNDAQDCEAAGPIELGQVAQSGLVHLTTIHSESGAKVTMADI